MKKQPLGLAPSEASDELGECLRRRRAQSKSLATVTIHVILSIQTSARGSRGP
jgi:hypothetical protein